MVVVAYGEVDGSGDVGETQLRLFYGLIPVCTIDVSTTSLSAASAELPRSTPLVHSTPILVPKSDGSVPRAPISFQSDHYQSPFAAKPREGGWSDNDESVEMSLSLDSLASPVSSSNPSLSTSLPETPQTGFLRGRLRFTPQSTPAASDRAAPAPFFPASPLNKRVESMAESVSMEVESDLSMSVVDMEERNWTDQSKDSDEELLDVSDDQDLNSPVVVAGPFNVKSLQPPSLTNSYYAMSPDSPFQFPSRLRILPGYTKSALSTLAFSPLPATPATRLPPTRRTVAQKSMRDRVPEKLSSSTQGDEFVIVDVLQAVGDRFTLVTKDARAYRVRLSFAAPSSVIQDCLAALRCILSPARYCEVLGHLHSEMLVHSHAPWKAFLSTTLTILGADPARGNEPMSHDILAAGGGQDSSFQAVLAYCSKAHGSSRTDSSDTSISPRPLPRLDLTEASEAMRAFHLLYENYKTRFTSLIRVFLLCSLFALRLSTQMIVVTILSLHLRIVRCCLMLRVMEAHA